MRFGLDENIIEKIIEVLEANPKVDKAYIFGSRAKGNYRPDSDIDIALKGYDLTLDDILKMSIAFEDQTLPYKIDLLDFYAIKEALLKEHIERVGIEFYSSWKEYKLYKITEPIKETYNPDGSDDFAYIGLEHIQQDTLRLNSIGISSDVTSNKFKFHSNDILFGKLRPYFRKVVKPNFSGICSTDIWVFRAKKNFDQNFLFYFLADKRFVDTANVGEGGSRMPRADWNHLKVTKWNIPPLPEQTSIASILSSLDDKIDLLHRQNKTLEQLAETLFTQWFVEEADESWEVGNVGSLFVLQRGHDLPSQNRSFGKYPIISSGGISGFHHEYKVKGPGVSTGRSGIIGNVFYVTDDFWPLNTSLFIKEYKIATPLFAFFFLKTLDLKTLNGGSAVPTLNRNDVHGIEAYLPPKALIDKFELTAKTYFQKIKANKIQIQTLTQLRDTLLPKLMSGEVRVKV